MCVSVSVHSTFAPDSLITSTSLIMTVSVAIHLQCQGRTSFVLCISQACEFMDYSLLVGIRKMETLNNGNAGGSAHRPGLSSFHRDSEEDLVLDALESSDDDADWSRCVCVCVFCCCVRTCVCVCLCVCV